MSIFWFAPIAITSLIVPSLVLGWFESRREARRISDGLRVRSQTRSGVAYVSNSIQKAQAKVLKTTQYLGIGLGLVGLVWGYIGTQETQSFLLAGILLVVYLNFTNSTLPQRMARWTLKRLVPHVLKHGGEAEVQDVLRAGWLVGKASFARMALEAHAQWRSPESIKAIADIPHIIHQQPWSKNREDDERSSTQLQLEVGWKGILHNFGFHKYLARSPWPGDLQRKAREEILFSRQMEEEFDPVRPDTVTRLLDNSLYWERVARAATQQDEEAFFDLVDHEAALEGTIERYFQDVFQVYPYLTQAYCESCRRWAIEYQAGRYTLPTCPECATAEYLRTDIKEVVGMVGSITVRRFEDGTLYWNLWDRTSDSVKLAEVDRIEVTSGRKMDYDWALAAIVEAFRNYHPDDRPRIPLHLPDSISLQTNTRKLIADFFVVHTPKTNH